LLCASFGVAGCGGSAHTATPHVASTPVATSQADKVAVAVTVAIPRAAASAARKPKYVSPGTQSFTVSVNGALAAEVDVDPFSSACSSQSLSTNCTAHVDAPVGDDTFTLSLYDGSNGRGPVLSTGTATQTVTRGALNTVAIPLRGVVASVVISLASPNPQMGAPSTTAVNVKAFDAAGSQITGTTPFATPLTLLNSDTSGATALSVTTVNGPSDAPPSLSYDGAGFVNASITATVPGATISPVAGILRPTLRGAEFAVPSGVASNNRFGTGSLALAGDGAVWFIDDRAICRVTTSGTVTEYALANATPYGITLGPDGALWFTDSGPNYIGRITTAGAQSSYTATFGGSAITTGADGALWFVSNGSLGRITTSGTYSSVPITLPPGSFGFNGQIFVRGSDGNFWSADSQIHVLRISPSGTVTQFPLPTSVNGTPSGMTSAADGTLWLVTDVGSVVHFKTDGSVLGVFQSPGFTSFTPFQIAQTPDGAIWYPVSSAGTLGAQLGRTDAIGTSAIFVIPNTASSSFAAAPTGVVTGSDGNLWYTRGTSVGRVQLH
jgi:virginiamycin B lyase